MTRTEQYEDVTRRTDPEDCERCTELDGVPCDEHGLVQMYFGLASTPVGEACLRLGAEEWAVIFGACMWASGALDEATLRQHVARYQEASREYEATVAARAAHQGEE